LFGFTLKNAAGETESWHIDLKEKGEVKKGLPENPTGEQQTSLLVFCVRREREFRP